MPAGCRVRAEGDGVHARKLLVRPAGEPSSPPISASLVSPYVAPEKLVVAPDCGMKYLPRERAFRKLEAMVAGARLVREDLGL